MLGCRLLSLCVRRLTCWLSGSPCWLLAGAGSLQARLVLDHNCVYVRGEIQKRTKRLNFGTSMTQVSAGLEIYCAICLCLTTKTKENHNVGPDTCISFVRSPSVQQTAQPGRAKVRMHLQCPHMGRVSQLATDSGISNAGTEPCIAAELARPELLQPTLPDSTLQAACIPSHVQALQLTGPHLSSAAERLCGRNSDSLGASLEGLSRLGSSCLRLWGWHRVLLHHLGTRNVTAALVAGAALRQHRQDTSATHCVQCAL